MATYTRCPDCGGLLEDDGSCSCGYGKRRPAQIKASPILCVWNDHGQSCTSRGVISHSLDGSGPWYCREHWARLGKQVPDGVGNYAVQPARRSLHMRQWDGWTYNPKTKRLEQKQAEREPGSDDDIVPAEADQA